MTALEMEVRPDLRPRVHRLVVLNEALMAVATALAVVVVGLLVYTFVFGTSVVLTYPRPDVTGPATIPQQAPAAIVTAPALSQPTWDYQSLVTTGRTPPTGAFTQSFDYGALVTQGVTPPMGYYATPSWATPLTVTPSAIVPTPDWDWDALVTEGRTPPMGDYR